MSGVTGTIPDTMRASVLHRPRDMRLEERATPLPGPGEVLVRVRSVGVCGSDVHYYEHGRIGDFVVREPLVLGHETSGDVVATGPGVSPDRIGERVAVEPGFPCRVCDQCRHGRYNLCPDIVFFGTPPVDGSLCDYVRVPADFAYPIPDALSYDAAGLLEPLSVGIWANRKAGTAPGGALLIAGAGPIGLVTTQIARAMGATEVVVTDVSPERLAVAERLGATGTVLAGQDSPGDGFDAFVDCSGAAQAIDSGIRAVRPAGQVVLVGMGADRLTLPFAVLQNRELNVTGTFRYANTWPAAIALAGAGAVSLDAMVSGRYSLPEAEAALLAGADPSHIKSVVTVASL